jgi:hypothetical protein
LIKRTRVMTLLATITRPMGTTITITQLTIIRLR